MSLDDNATSEPDLDALARATIALGEAATPGPWFRGNGAHWSREVRAGDEDGVAFCGHADFDADAALIAAYRSSAPALATALLAAREAMRSAHRALVDAANGAPLSRLVGAIEVLEAALRSGAGTKETT